MESLQNEAKNPAFEKHLSARLLLSAAALGVMFSWLFAKQSLGINMLCFTLLVYAFALLNSEAFIVKRFREAPLIWLACIPVLLLSVLMFTSSTMMNGLAVLVVLFVLFVQYLVLSGAALNDWYRPAFIGDLFFGVINRAVIGLPSFSAGVVNATFRGKTNSRKGAALGVLAGVVLLLVVVPVLAAADENLGVYINAFFSAIRFGDVVLYGFLFLLGASMSAGLVANARSENRFGPKAAAPRGDTRPLEGSTTAVALTMVSVVYVIFAVIQFGYFFDPRTTLSLAFGLTSSDYAVRGFGELMFITCLNFVLLAAAQRFTARRADGRPQPYLKTLYILLVAVNFVMLASAHLRMRLYEVSFGYTVSRVLSHSFMLLLVVLNVIMLARVFSEKVKALKLFAVTALIYFVVLTAVNPERFVARQNIARYEREGKIDAAYLFYLSGDALVDACSFAEAHPEVWDDDVSSAAEYALQRTEEQMDNGWQSVNLAERRAYESLKTLTENAP